MTKRAQKERIFVIDYIRQNFGVIAAKAFFFETVEKRHWLEGSPTIGRTPYTSSISGTCAANHHDWRAESDRRRNNKIKIQEKKN